MTLCKMHQDERVKLNICCQANVLFCHCDPERVCPPSAVILGCTLTPLSSPLSFPLSFPHLSPSLPPLKPLQICPARSCSLIGRLSDWPGLWLAESWARGRSVASVQFCRLERRTAERSGACRQNQVNINRKVCAQVCGRNRRVDAASLLLWLFWSRSRARPGPDCHSEPAQLTCLTSADRF